MLHSIYYFSIPPLPIPKNYQKEYSHSFFSFVFQELLPIVLMFEVPTNTLVVPDNTSPAIHSIAQKYNVTITFKQVRSVWKFDCCSSDPHVPCLCIYGGIKNRQTIIFLIFAALSSASIKNIHLHFDAPFCSCTPTSIES